MRQDEAVVRACVPNSAARDKLLEEDDVPWVEELGVYAWCAALSCPLSEPITCVTCPPEPITLRVQLLASYYWTRLQSSPRCRARSTLVRSEGWHAGERCGVHTRSVLAGTSNCPIADTLTRTGSRG